MSPVGNFKEDKYLLEFDELQKIIDTIEDTTLEPRVPWTKYTGEIGGE